MKKLFYFLMVGLAFTALQVANVEAQDGPPPMTDGPPPGEHPPGEHHDGPPPGEHHEKDCSEIPNPAGRALCEKTTAEGRTPTIAECMTMETQEGKDNCMSHVEGGMPQ